MNRDMTTGPLPCPFARLLAPLTHSLVPHCLLCSLARSVALICSLTCSLKTTWFYLIVQRPWASASRNPIELNSWCTAWYTAGWASGHEGGKRCKTTYDLRFSAKHVTIYGQNKVKIEARGVNGARKDQRIDTELLFFLFQTHEIIFLSCLTYRITYYA